MDDKDRIAALEAVLAQMLKPVRNVPFSVIIRSLSEQRVIPIDLEDPQDIAILRQLEQMITTCAAELKAEPIVRPRPNEVGNDVETYVMRALIASRLPAARPTSSAGRGQSTGYPDIMFKDAAGRDFYLECKIFSHGTAATTMRSFYLSPSETFKVARDARHLLLAFGMEAEAVSGSRNSRYSPRSYKLVDLHSLLCDVKYEFNSDNRRLYSHTMILSEGDI